MVYKDVAYLKGHLFVGRDDSAHRGRNCNNCNLRDVARVHKFKYILIFVLINVFRIKGTARPTETTIGLLKNPADYFTVYLR